jgi:hypothetical protein
MVPQPNQFSGFLAGRKGELQVEPYGSVRRSSMDSHARYRQLLRAVTGLKGKSLVSSVA